MKQRVLSILRSPTGNSKYPYIHVSGKWLSDNGLQIGEKVLLKIKKGNVNIQTIKFTNQDGDIEIED